MIAVSQGCDFLGGLCCLVVVEKFEVAVSRYICGECEIPRLRERRSWRGGVGPRPPGSHRQCIMIGHAQL